MENSGSYNIEKGHHGPNKLLAQQTPIIKALWANTKTCKQKHKVKPYKWIEAQSLQPSLKTIWGF